jgi:hypothetical protein
MGRRIEALRLFKIVSSTACVLVMVLEVFRDRSNNVQYRQLVRIFVRWRGRSEILCIRIKDCN